LLRYLLIFINRESFINLLNYFVGGAGLFNLFVLREGLTEPVSTQV